MNTVRVALLRSMVIGKRRVSGADVRALAEAAGGTDARSVIATGNVVFRSRKAPATLERDMEVACVAEFGKATEIVVKTAEDWRTLVAANPFPDEVKTAPARVLAWAMREPLPDAGLAALRARASGPERVERTKDGDFYMWFGAGDISASKLPSAFSLKTLGAVGTNRNWNTVLKITAVVDEMSA